MSEEEHRNSRDYAPLRPRIGAANRPTQLEDPRGSTPQPRQVSSASQDETRFVPENQSSERQLSLLVFLLACAYLCLFRRYTPIDLDEGIILQGAQRILQGQVLYRDFFSYFTPGSYYLTALLFRIFGSSLLVPRTALAISGGIFSALTYLMARRVCRRWSALLVAGLLTVSCLPFRFLVLHNWDSTLWAYLALYCALRIMETPHWAWALGMGTMASFTFLFEQSKGAGLAVGLGIGFLAIAVAAPKNDPAASPLAAGQSPLERLAPNRTIFFALLAGVSWPLLATAVYFSAQHSLSTMLADWIWPLQHYVAANHVPYGYQNWSDETWRSLFSGRTWGARLITTIAVSPLFLVPVLPLLSIALFAYWWNQMRQRRTPHSAPQSKCAYYVLTNATFIGLLLSIVMVRSDSLHFMYLAPLYCLMLAWILDGRDTPGRIFRAVRPLWNAYILLAFGAMSTALLLRTVNTPYKLATRRGMVSMSGQDSVVEYVQAHVAPGETILVYPYLPFYYYLTDTFSPTRYEYLQPGMNTTEQFHDVVSRLESRPIKMILLEPFFAEKIPASWPEAPAAAMETDPVSDYILKHYHSCRVLRSPVNWRFLAMIPKNVPCP